MASDKEATQEEMREEMTTPAKPIDEPTNKIKDMEEDTLDEASFITAVETMSLADPTIAPQVTDIPPKEDAMRESSKTVAIRHQVEYYLSDKNLKTDAFLMKKIHGSDNNPLPIRVICDFKKMHGFAFEEVVEAIRGSQYLDVVTCKAQECVVRKVPYVSEKSNKKKSAKPTGFEEYWTDPPVTPDDYANEVDLYDAERPFAERIETALQKFKSKRRMNGRVLPVFIKWIKFGGIETGPKQFSGGLDNETLEKSTASEIASMAATEFVGEDKYATGLNEKYSVNFEAVAKGFLSSIVPVFIDLQSESAIKECINVLRNFLNYILHHNVCPEHNLDIYEARRVCEVAENELPDVGRVVPLLPGDFNKACSTLFGGRYKGMYADDQEWNKDFHATPQQPVKIGMSDHEARAVFAMALSCYAPNELFESDIQRQTLETGGHWTQIIVDTEDHVGLKVVAMKRAPADIAHFYEKEMGGRYPTLGRLHCEPWAIPSLASSDFPAGFRPAPRPRGYCFLVEHDVMEYCFLGMRLEATIHTLSGGITFLDNVLGVHCSFYTFLENEMVRGWKDPVLYTREEQLERIAKGTDEEDAMILPGDGE